MSPRMLIWKEIRQRPLSMAMCLLAITLGVTAFVAIRSVTEFSERAVAQQLESLGANLLLLPQTVSLQDYYGADQHGQTLPEVHALRLALANVEGVEAISAKLCVPAEFNGRPVTLTGILPQSEFQAKAAWQGVQAFSRKHVGCKKEAAGVNGEDGLAPAKMSGHVIEQLSDDEAILGADVASATNLAAGDRISLLGHSFTVVSVLPPTGTVDDGRVLAHLHTVQHLAGAGEVVNAIEITACCEDAAGSLVDRLRSMFGDAKVVTIAHVVQTQVSVNRTMARLSYLFLGILVVVGMASIGATMFANVSERRREIGTLMALGATPRFVGRLFLGKALAVGSVGGILGFLVGTALAVALGPLLAGVRVEPIPSLAVVSLILAAAVASMATFLPARRAAMLDPCVCFKEV